MKYHIIACLFLAALIGGCATSRYKSAEELLKKKDYNNAIRSYLRILDPHLRYGKRFIYYDKEAITGIGIVYWHMKRYDTAVKILDMVIEKDPSSGKALFYLGLSYEGMGRDDEAIGVYKRYSSLLKDDHYRKVLAGRLDWVVRRKITREIQLAIENESILNVSQFPEKSVAVLYFLSLSEDEQWHALRKGIAEMMITDLAQVEELRVIERLRINQLMGELRLGTTGLVDEETSPRMGRLLGVRNLVKGSYMVMPSLKMTLDAGIYKTETSLFPVTSNLEGDLVQLFQMEKELVLRILDYFEIQLQPLLREKILKIPTENMMAFMSYCQGLDALDKGEYGNANEFFKNAVRMDPDFTMARDRIMIPIVWEMTHNRNINRVVNDVAQYIKSRPMRMVDETYEIPKLVSTINRFILLLRNFVLG